MNPLLCLLPRAVSGPRAPSRIPALTRIGAAEGAAEGTAEGRVGPTGPWGAVAASSALLRSPEMEPTVTCVSLARPPSLLCPLSTYTQLEQYRHGGRRRPLHDPGRPHES